MGPTPIPAVLLARIRAWAADPGALVFPVNSDRGSIALFPADVRGKTDQELLAFIVRRCNETQ